MKLLPKPFRSETYTCKIDKPVTVSRTMLEEVFKNSKELPGVMYEHDKFIIKLPLITGSYKEAAVIEGYLIAEGGDKTTLDIVIRPANTFIGSFFSAFFWALYSRSLVF